LALPSAQRGDDTWVDEHHKYIHTPSPIGVFFAFTGYFDLVLCTFSTQHTNTAPSRTFENNSR
jgi:hypothetical protein